MEIEIKVNEANQRFDRFLRKWFKNTPEVKLWDIYSRLRKWAITVNGKKKDQAYKLIMWDIVEFSNNDVKKDPTISNRDKKSKKNNISIEKIKEQILYEDKNRIFWNKPYDIVIHPGNFHTNDLTLNDYLEAYFSYWNKNNSETFKPSFWFRLDKDTSWVIVWAKNYDSLQYINEIIRDRKTEKHYIAIVKWSFPNSLTMAEPLFKWYNAKFWRAQTFVNQEKWLESKTQAFLVSTFSDPVIWKVSLLKIKLFTGRMHQIRVHLSHHGFPILGDIMYWDDWANTYIAKKYKISRQLLHSYSYGFIDKETGKKITVKAPIPNDFQKLFPNQKTIDL